MPDSARLQAKSATSFLSSSVYKRESAVDAGQQIGDGTFVKAQACDAGDVLLSGGPANINATSTLLESPAPGTTNGWQARMNKNGGTDNWSVVILCIDQYHGPVPSSGGGGRPSPPPSYPRRPSLGRETRCDRRPSP